MAVEYEIIEKSGSWFSYNGDKFAQGREKAKEYISSNAELKNELEAKIREKFSNK
jgi:recombination protein RecA